MSNQLLNMWPEIELSSGDVTDLAITVRFVWVISASLFNTLQQSKNHTKVRKQPKGQISTPMTTPIPFGEHFLLNLSTEN